MMDIIAKQMSLLSLDAYNRGYNPGISAGNEQDEAQHANSDGLGTSAELSNGEIVYTEIGGFEVLPLIKNETLNIGFVEPEIYDDWKSINFYAQAYRAGAGIEGIQEGTIVIAYRGTDNPNPLSAGSDVWKGWTQGGGFNSAQTQAAADFYLRVAASEPGEIIFTGHSLGGGLAGFMAAGTGSKAWIFDNMPYEGAIEAIFTEPGTLAFEEMMDKYAIIDSLISYRNGEENLTQEDKSFIENFINNLSTLTELFITYTDIEPIYAGIRALIATSFPDKNAYGFLQNTPDESNITAYHIPGEVMDLLRIAQGTNEKSIPIGSNIWGDIYNPAGAPHYLTTPTKLHISYIPKNQMRPLP